MRYVIILLFGFSSSLCTSGVAKLGQTGARALATRGCAPPVQVFLKIIGAECTIINRELGTKVHKGVEIKLRGIAICTFRITRSRMLPWSQCMRVCCKYYSDLTLCAQVRSEGMVKVSLVPGAHEKTEERLVHTVCACV